MRIKDLSEGFVDSFKKGYGKPIQKAAPVQNKDPFAGVNPKDVKKILAAILNGQQLDQIQLATLKKVYNKL